VSNEQESGNYICPNCGTEFFGEPEQDQTVEQAEVFHGRMGQYDKDLFEKYVAGGGKVEGMVHVVEGLGPAGAVSDGKGN
jgi:hypothetical protein